MNQHRKNICSYPLPSKFCRFKITPTPMRSGQYAEPMSSPEKRALKNSIPTGSPRPDAPLLHSSCMFTHISPKYTFFAVLPPQHMLSRSSGPFNFFLQTFNVVDWSERPAQKTFLYLDFVVAALLLLILSIISRRHIFFTTH